MRLLAGLLLLFGAATAQELWTVQTVAFPDYRQALAAEADLEALGFDAYTEFTMFEGRQYTRVRVGCFDSRPAATRMAELLAGSFTDEAVVQPLTEGAEVAFCLRDDVGFIKPADWSIQSQDSLQIVFRVHLAGYTGYVRMRNAEWLLLTEIEPATVPSLGPSYRFEQITLGGQQVVRAAVGGTELNICTGRLLWQSGRTVVIERGNTVSACIVETPQGPGL